MRFLTQEEDIIKMMDEEEADERTVIDKVLHRYPGTSPTEAQKLLEDMAADGVVGFWAGDWHLL